MVHAKNETPATINNAGSTNFNFSFILTSFIKQYYTPVVLNVYKQKTPLMGGA